jgi:hypothetical protein
LVERHAYTVNVISSNLVPPTKSPKCYGSITDSKSAGRGSTPWGDAKVYIGVRRMVRQQIANLNNAGSTPVTYSSCIKTTLITRHLCGFLFDATIHTC